MWVSSLREYPVVVKVIEHCQPKVEWHKVEFKTPRWWPTQGEGTVLVSLHTHRPLLPRPAWNGSNLHPRQWHVQESSPLRSQSLRQLWCINYIDQIKGQTMFTTLRAKIRKGEKVIFLAKGANHVSTDCKDLIHRYYQSDQEFSYRECLLIALQAPIKQYPWAS